MTIRAWGEAQDREAARQLGLAGDLTIFMTGYEADYADDIRSVVTKFAEEGYVDPVEVVDAVEERIRSVMLPKGFVLVDLKPIDADSPVVYGVVDFSIFRNE